MTSDLPEAYSFSAEISLDEMLARLNASSRLRWRMRDSDSYGDYVSASLSDEKTWLRIFPVGSGSFVLAIDWIYSLAGSMPREEVEEIIQRDVFPHIGARGVTPRESWD